MTNCSRLRLTGSDWIDQEQPASCQIMQTVCHSAPLLHLSSTRTHRQHAGHECDKAWCRHNSSILIMLLLGVPPSLALLLCGLAEPQTIVPIVRCNSTTYRCAKARRFNPSMYPTSWCQYFSGSQRKSNLTSGLKLTTKLRFVGHMVMGDDPHNS